jgi:hypothetical protein
MNKKFHEKIRWVAAIGLLIISLVCLMLVGDRVWASLFNLWKFSGYQPSQGIDLGAQSSVLFLTACLYGLAGCFAIAIFYKPHVGTGFFRIVMAAGGIYFTAGSLLVLMVLSELGYLYCGR